MYNDDAVDFDSATSACEGAWTSAGYASRLTAISSAEEAQFIASLSGVRAGRPRWVGVRRNGQGNFEDLYGEDFNPSGIWHEGEPNGGECVSQGLSKKKFDSEFFRLNDATCSNSFGYVCQWCRPPEPTTTTSTTAEPTTITTAEPTTTTTTEEPTTTTEAPTTETPCPVSKDDLLAGDAAFPEMVAYIQSLGEAAGTYPNRKSGKVDKSRASCEAICNKQVWGLGCLPCPASYFTDEASCMSPGPFGEGDLCATRAFNQNGETVKEFREPIQPCCQRGVDEVTCGAPKENKCDCEALAKPSVFAAPSRIWDNESSTCTDN